jgi:hypothetical protein
MKCWKCGNELTTGDAPNSAQCRRCEQASISSSPASAGSAVPVSDDDILSIWRTVRPSAKQDRAMVYQTGPYDVDHPTWELRRLVELAIEYAQNRTITIEG